MRFSSRAIEMTSNAHEIVTETWRHPANRRRRVKGLATAVAGELMLRLGRHPVVQLGEAQIPAMRGQSSQRLLRGSPADWNEMLAWQRLVKPGDWFVDIGANVGIYTLWLAQFGVRVIAVEPDASAVRLLRENVIRNGYDVEIHRAALSDRVGTARLTSGLGAGNHLTGAETEGQDVPLTTLDMIIGRRTVAGMKVDVEGAEGLVLQGARVALSEGRISNIQLEWNKLSEEYFGESRNELTALLRHYGYTSCLAANNGDLVPVRMDLAPRRRQEMFAVLDPNHVTQEPSTS